MNDLTILHLSDLHITWKNSQSYPTILENLINDVKEQSTYLKWPIVIVVTGDIVHKGDFSTPTSNAVLAFFRDLKDALGNKFFDIFVVPGNHDKLQTTMQSEFMGIYGAQRSPMSSESEELLDLNNRYYGNFLTLRRKIYGIFNKVCVSDHTYNVELLEVPIQELKERAIPKKTQATNNATSTIKDTQTQDYTIFTLDTPKEVVYCPTDANDNDDCTQVSAYYATNVSEVGIDDCSTDEAAPSTKEKKKSLYEQLSSHKFCFISLNSSLACCGKEDYRHLRLGDKQIQNLSYLYEEATEGISPDLTFVLSHHPLNWMIGEEEDIIQKKLLSPSAWNAQILLCGHVHNRDAISTRNNHHSLTTLTTGFGWPDAGEEHAEPHTYSYYVFNLDINSIDIYVRSTNDGGTFMPDFRFYGHAFSGSSTKTVYPIDSNKTQAYFLLGAAPNRSGKALFFSERFVKQLESYGQNMCTFQSHITRYLSHLETHFLENVERYILQQKLNSQSDQTNSPSKITNEQLEEAKKKVKEECNKLSKVWASRLEHDTPESKKELAAFFASNSSILFNVFNSFLQAICTYMQNDLRPSSIADTPDSQSPGSQSEGIRVHARFYSSSNNAPVVYKPLCFSSIGCGNNIPREIPWNGSLIEAAFLSKRALLYEPNISAAHPPSPCWENFLTIIPWFKQNEIGTPKVTRPAITFGVSCTTAEYNDLLFILDFFQIDHVLGNIIDSFLDIFPVNMEQYVKYADSPPGNDLW